MREQSVICDEYKKTCIEIEVLRGLMRWLQEHVGKADQELLRAEIKADELHAELIAAIAAAGLQVNEEDADGT